MPLRCEGCRLVLTHFSPRYRGDDSAFSRMCMQVLAPPWEVARALHRCPAIVGRALCDAADWN